MTIKLTRNKLYQKLKTVGRIVQPSKINAFSEQFLFETSESGLSVTGTDLMGSIRVKNIECEKTQGEASFTVNARLLLSALAELPEQPLELNADKNKLVVKYGGGAFDIPTMDPAQFPKLDTNGNNKLLHLPLNMLYDGIKQTIDCALPNDLRPVMSGVYMDVSEGRITFVATNAQKLAMQEFELDTQIISGSIIPNVACKLILNILADVSNDAIIQLNIGAKNIIFNAEGYEFIYRLIDGNYPDYRRVVPQNYLNIHLSTKDLISALKRVGVFSNEKSNEIIIEILENQFDISTKDIDFSTSASETMSVISDFNLRIGFNYSLLLSLLNTVSSENIELWFSEPQRPIVMKPLADEKTTLLLMPLVIN